MACRRRPHALCGYKLRSTLMHPPCIHPPCTPAPLLLSPTLAQPWCRQDAHPALQACSMRCARQQLASALFPPAPILFPHSIALERAGRGPSPRRTALRPQASSEPLSPQPAAAAPPPPPPAAQQAPLRFRRLFQHTGLVMWPESLGGMMLLSAAWSAAKATSVVTRFLAGQLVLLALIYLWLR